MVENNPQQFLYKPTEISCEFCDKVSTNRYNSMIHNTSHIIIPLIRHSLVESKECMSRKVSELNNKEERTEIDETDDVEVYCKSVHYDDLILPRRQQCACGQTFPNRFELITHNKPVIKIRKPRLFLCTICDRYIVGNYHRLNKHLRNSHPNHKIPDGPKSDSLKKKLQPICNMCGLKYSNIDRHNFIHHGIINETIHQTKASKSFARICHLCYMFFKNHNTYIYKYVSDLEEAGKRITCEGCGQLFFSLKLYERIRKNHFEVKKRLVDRLLFEDDLMNTIQYHSRKPKPITNAVRLKNIRQRLKFMKKLSKL